MTTHAHFSINLCKSDIAVAPSSLSASLCLPRHIVEILFPPGSPTVLIITAVVTFQFIHNYQRPWVPVRYRKKVDHSVPSSHAWPKTILNPRSCSVYDKPVWQFVYHTTDTWFGQQCLPSSSHVCCVVMSPTCVLVCGQLFIYIIVDPSIQWNNVCIANFYYCKLTPKSTALVDVWSVYNGWRYCWHVYFVSCSVRACSHWGWLRNILPNKMFLAPKKCGWRTKTIFVCCTFCFISAAATTHTSRHLNTWLLW